MTTYHHFETIATDDGPMPTYVATPEGSGKHPLVYVIHGHGGITPTELMVADRFAENGFVGVAPDLFFWGQKCFSPVELDSRRNQLNDPLVVRSINAADSFFQSQSYIAPGQYGILGFCMGGRVAYLMATATPSCAVAASYYGGGILRREGAPAPSELSANIKCPIQIFHGDKDQHPTTEEMLELEQEMIKYGVDYELIRYAEFGHAFMGRQNAASDDAWPKMLNKFHDCLAATQAGATQVARV